MVRPETLCGFKMVALNKRQEAEPDVKDVKIFFESDLDGQDKVERIWTFAEKDQRLYW